MANVTNSGMIYNPCKLYPAPLVTFHEAPKMHHGNLDWDQRVDANPQRPPARDRRRRVLPAHGREKVRPWRIRDVPHGGRVHEERRWRRDPVRGRPQNGLVSERR